MASSTSNRTQNILITGASSGIGEALAMQYAKTTAARLFLCGRNAERLEEVCRKCKNLGAKVHSEILDVTDREAVKKWIADCDKTAPLNLVIANAGIGTVNETADSIYQTFDTNVYGVLNTVLPAVELYRQRGNNGSAKQIAVVSSLAGYHGLPTCPSYSASKAAVKAYGEALRAKLRPEGIKVSVICPGFVRSRITDQNTCPMPFFMEAPYAAKAIAEGLAADKAVISFPAPLRFTTWLVSILPNWLSEFIYAKLPNKA